MSFSNQSNLGEYLEAALEKLHQTEHFDEYLQYLNNEWYYTADDLRLACEDVKVWEGIKLPGRLKIELSKLLLQPLEQQEYSESVNGNSNYDESTKALLENDVQNSWVKCWAEDHNCYYFYNTVTEESSWEDPNPDSHDPYDIYLYSEEQKRWMAIDDPYRTRQDYGMDADPFSISAKPTPNAFPRVPFFAPATAADSKHPQLSQSQQSADDFKQNNEAKQGSSTFTKPRILTRGSSSQDVLFVKSPNRIGKLSEHRQENRHTPTENRQDNRQEHKQNYYYTDKRKNSTETDVSVQDTTPTNSSTLLARRAKRSNSSNSKSKVIRLNTYAVSTTDDSDSSREQPQTQSIRKNGSKSGSKNGSAPNSAQKKQLNMSAVSKDEAKERHSPMNSRPLARPLDLNFSTTASIRTETSSKKTASESVSLPGAEAKSSPPKRAYRRHPSHMYDWDSKKEAPVEAPTPSTLWSQVSNADSTEERPVSAVISTVGSAVNSIKDTPTPRSPYHQPTTTALARDFDNDSASEVSQAATSREHNASPPAATSREHNASPPAATSREEYDYYKDYDNTPTDLPLREGYGAYADGTEPIQQYDERSYAVEDNNIENNIEYAEYNSDYYDYNADNYDTNRETGRDSGNDVKAEQYRQDYYDYKQQYDDEYDNNTNEYGEYDNNTNEYGDYDNNTNEYAEYGDYNENTGQYEKYYNENTGEFEPNYYYNPTTTDGTATAPTSEQVEHESLYYHLAQPSAPPAPLEDGAALEADSPVGHHYIATPGRTATTPHIPQLHLRSGGNSRSSSQRDRERDSSRQSFTPTGTDRSSKKNRDSKSASPNVRYPYTNSPVATPIQHAQHDDSFYLAEAALANSSDEEVQQGGAAQYHNNSNNLMDLALGSPPPSQHNTPTTTGKKTSKKNRITQLFRLNLFGKGPAVPSTPPPPRENTYTTTSTSSSNDKYKNRPLPQPNTKTTVSHSPRVEKHDINIRTKPKPDDINSKQSIHAREKYFQHRSHLLPLRYGTGNDRTAYASKAEEQHYNNIQRLIDQGYSEHDSIIALNMCEGDYGNAKLLLEEEH